MTYDELIHEIKELRSCADRLEKNQRHGHREQKTGFRLEHILEITILLFLAGISWLYVTDRDIALREREKLYNQSTETAKYLASIASTVHSLEREIGRINVRVERLRPDYPRFGPKEHAQSHNER